MSQQKKKLYVVANSHLDPVWLWSRASGQYTWLNTAYCIVQMMQRHPDLKFSCSSSAMYRYIEETAPALFEQIRELIQEGRWEAVGGWEVQSDAIIADTESLIRQGTMGKQYFLEKFGIDVKIGYCVDSFGHSAHLPKILNATGFTHYVFLRPTSNHTHLPYLFDWRSEDGSQVRAMRLFDAYGYRNCTKAEFLDRIDAHMEKGLAHQTFFLGTGDHGGGIYEQHYQWLKEASQKYDIRFSTLGEYFRAVENENIPVIENQELGPVFRGAYSACYDIKRKIALGTARLDVAAKCGIPPERLRPLWQELLFLNFHDSLSGTSSFASCKNDIEPALGGVLSAANSEIHKALCKRSSSIDTSFLKEGGVYLWNAEQRATKGIVEVEGFSDPNELGSDFNALMDQQGNVYPLQIGLQTAALFAPYAMSWGKLTAVVPMEPNEEKILAYTRVPQLPNKLGFESQYKTLQKIHFLRFHDDAGTWGFDLEQYIRAMDTAELVKTEELADGPVFSILRAFYRINASMIRLDIWKFSNINELRLDIKADWKERLSVLKMAYAITDEQTSFVTGTPGGKICRYCPKYPSSMVQILNGRRIPLYPNSGECAMLGWCGAFSQGTGTAFYAADLHSCDFAEGAMRLTLLRSVPYADHHPFPRNDEFGYMDMGVQFRQAWLLENAAVLPENVPGRCRSRLGNIECAEITAHKISGTCPEFSFPMICCSDKVVVESVQKKNNNHWEILVNNYGETEQIVLPNGKTEILPALSIRNIIL